MPESAPQAHLENPKKCPSKIIPYQTICAIGHYIVPRSKFFDELTFWKAVGINQKQRLKAMMSALNVNITKPIAASADYLEAAALCEVSDEDVAPLNSSQADIQEFLQKRRDQLLAILNTNPIFTAWQQISSVTTLSIFYQASLLAAILQKKPTLSGLLKNITITDSSSHTQQATTPVSVELHNGLAYTQLIQDSDLITTASGFLNYIERIDFLMMNSNDHTVLMLPPGHHAGVPQEGVFGAAGFCWAYAPMVPALNHKKPVFVIDVDINSANGFGVDEHGQRVPMPHHGEDRDNFYLAEVAANGVYPLVHEYRIDPKSPFYNKFYSKTDRCYRVDASFCGKKPQRNQDRNNAREQFIKHVMDLLEKLEQGSLVVLSMGMDSIYGDPFSTYEHNNVKYFSSLWSKDIFIEFITDVQTICCSKQLKLLTTTEGGYNVETLKYVSTKLYGQNQFNDAASAANEIQQAQQQPQGASMPSSSHSSSSSSDLSHLERDIQYYSTISKRENFFLPRGDFFQELARWPAHDTDQNERITTMIAALNIPKQYRVRSSQYYATAAELCAVTKEEVEPLLEDAPDKIQEYLQDKTALLLDIIDTHPIFKAWQQSSNKKTMCFLFQASLLAAMLQRMPSLADSLKNFTIRVLQSIGENLEMEVLTQLDNGLASTTFTANNLVTTASSFLHMIERFDLATTIDLSTNPILIVPPTYHTSQTTISWPHPEKNLLGSDDKLATVLTTTNHEIPESLEIRKLWIPTERQKLFEQVNTLDSLHKGAIVVLPLDMSSIPKHSSAKFNTLWDKTGFLRLIKGIQTKCLEKKLFLITTIEGGDNLNTLTTVFKKLYRQASAEEDESTESEGHEAQPKIPEFELNYDPAKQQLCVILSDLDTLALTGHFKIFSGQENGTLKEKTQCFQIWSQAWTGILNKAKELLKAGNFKELRVESADKNAIDLKKEVGDNFAALKNPFSIKKDPFGREKPKPTKEHTDFSNMRKSFRESIHEIYTIIQLKQGVPSMPSNSSNGSNSFASPAQQPARPPAQVQTPKPTASQSANSSVSSSAASSKPVQMPASQGSRPLLTTGLSLDARKKLTLSQSGPVSTGSGSSSSASVSSSSFASSSGYTRSLSSAASSKAQASAAGAGAAANQPAQRPFQAQAQRTMAFQAAPDAASKTIASFAASHNPPLPPQEPHQASLHTFDEVFAVRNPQGQPRAAASSSFESSSGYTGSLSSAASSKAHASAVVPAAAAAASKQTQPLDPNTLQSILSEAKKISVQKKAAAAEKRRETIEALKMQLPANVKRRVDEMTATDDQILQIQQALAKRQKEIYKQAEEDERPVVARAIREAEEAEARETREEDERLKTLARNALEKQLADQLAGQKAQLEAQHQKALDAQLKLLEASFSQVASPPTPPKANSSSALFGGGSQGLPQSPRLPAASADGSQSNQSPSR